MDSGQNFRMGRAGRWLRALLGGKKEPKPVENKGKQRWRSGKPCKEDVCNPTTDVEQRYSYNLCEAQNKHAIAVAAATAAVAEAAVTAAQAAAAVVRLTSSGRRNSNTPREVGAAIRIQAAFRGYLARRALRALKGLVKLQAAVRGYMVRKQAAATLRCMQVLVGVQARIRARRLRISQQGLQSSSRHGGAVRCASRQQLQERQNPLFIEDDDSWRWLDRWMAAQSPQSAKTLEIDTGGPARESTPAPQDLNGECTVRYSGSPSSKAGSHESEYVYADRGYSGCLNYMADTESSKARVRSHSAPKQRPHHSEKSAVSSRRRLSFEGAVENKATLVGTRMQRSSSQVRSTDMEHRLGRSTMCIADNQS